MRISDWSSDVCSSDLPYDLRYHIKRETANSRGLEREEFSFDFRRHCALERQYAGERRERRRAGNGGPLAQQKDMADDFGLLLDHIAFQRPARLDRVAITAKGMPPKDQVHALLILPDRSEEHTSEIQYIM